VLKLHLGCGDKHIPGFVNVDIQDSPAVDVLADVMELPYKENSVDLIYACSMLEHFGRNNNLKFFRKTCWTDVVKHWYTILKPGGKLYISVPDFEAVCIEYLENKDINSILGITLGGQKNEEDLHGMLFDFKIISTELESIGFSSIDRYNWKNFEPFKNNDYDDLSVAYLPHMDVENGRHMMLNVRGVK
tara:strand:+ start:3983 stop:4549 length:567 start_codon:yes stop_codon:yes gene_type:complete